MHTKHLILALSSICQSAPFFTSKTLVPYRIHTRKDHGLEISGGFVRQLRWQKPNWSGRASVHICPGPPPGASQTSTSSSPSLGPASQPHSLIGLAGSSRFWNTVPRTVRTFDALESRVADDIHPKYLPVVFWTSQDHHRKKATAKRDGATYRLWCAAETAR